MLLGFGLELGTAELGAAGLELGTAELGAAEELEAARHGADLGVAAIGIAEGAAVSTGAAAARLLPQRGSAERLGH